MKTSVAIIAVLCIGLTMAQWPCQNYGFMNPVPNCASCTLLGSVWANSGNSFNFGSDQAAKPLNAFVVCTSCTTGFYLNQTACGNCTANCNFCNLNGACNRGGCAKGYYYQPWTQWCVACPSAGNCLQCELAYSVSASNWLTANPYVGGTSATAQDSFNPVWDPIANSWNGSLTATASNYWVAPSLTIEGGYGWGPNYCTACAYGYYIGAAGFCVQCPTNFASCSVSSGQLSLSCKTGYIVTFSSGVPSCTACSGNAATCVSSSATGTIPAASAYSQVLFTASGPTANSLTEFLAQTGTAGTYAATVAATGTSSAYIQPSFTPTASGTLANYPLFAAVNPLKIFYNYGASTASTTYGTQPTPFSNCLPGYFTVTGPPITCTTSVCTANCVQCASATSCIASAGACATGYVATVGTTGTLPVTCTSCSGAANCLICDPSDATWISSTYSITSCAVCNAGYILNPSTKACVACPMGCYNSTPQAYPQAQSCYYNGVSAVCAICAQNYTMFQNDQSLPGSTTNTGTGISSFSVATITGNTIVYPNYNLIPQVGSEAGGWSFSGAAASSTKWYSSTYFWSIRGVGGVCVALPGNCSHGQATSATQLVAATCQQCYPGFGLIVNYTNNATSCQKCNTTGCLTCDGLGVCTTCNTTMYVQQNQCQQCPYNCSVCANSTYCFNNCTKNYNWNSVTGQCLPNGAERIFLAGFALLSAMLYFI